MTSRIRQATVEPYRQPFAAPLSTARGVFTEREGCWVRLDIDSGETGYGDAAPFPGFGAPADTVFSSLGHVAEDLEGLILPAPDEIHHFLDGWNLSPVGRAAFELAMLDVHAQRRGVPLSRLLTPDAPTHVPSHVLVNSSDGAARAVAGGAQTLKCKVGRTTVSDDIDFVRAIRAAAPGATLRLDANGSWSLARASMVIEALADCGAVVYEQPLASADLEGLRTLRQRFDVFVALDESVVHHGAAVVNATLADAVVLKPMFIGGLLPSRDIAGLAKARHLETWVTHAMASAVDYAGALHCAASIGGGPHGFLREGNPINGGGEVIMPTGIGHGGRV